MKHFPDCLISNPKCLTQNYIQLMKQSQLESRNRSARFNRLEFAEYVAFSQAVVLKTTILRLWIERGQELFSF
jgi:hypothetical protein